MTDLILPDSEVWTKSLKNIPRISSVTVAKHLEKCGKSTVGEKAYKFFVENYVHDVEVLEKRREGLSLIRGRCYRSQRKNEAPHTIQMTVKTINDAADLTEAGCTCKAGTGGHCNHVFALLHMLSHYCMLGINEIPATVSCTSLPQEWHKPRGKKVEPEPVMNCTFVKSVFSKQGKRKSDPIYCRLYDARNTELKSDGWSQQKIMDMCSYLCNEEKHPPFSYLLSDQEISESKKTVFGSVALGSPLSYQLTDVNSNKTNFRLTRSDDAVSPSKRSKDMLNYPELPLPSACQQAFSTPTLIPAEQDAILKEITININEAWYIQTNTTSQAENAMWYQQRKYRLTASNFGRVIIRKKKPTKSFLNSIFQSKDLSNVSSVQNGKQNEAVTKTMYAKKMQKNFHDNFTVYDCGLVVNPSWPYLGASPDGKVFDPSAKNNFGLLEIKCPYKWRNCSMEEACEDPNFYCHMVNGVPHLKSDGKEPYYVQVQGQLALTGLDWCDFVVYFSGSQSLNVERIQFNSLYWDETVLPKLSTFYFEHALPFLTM